MLRRAGFSEMGEKLVVLLKELEGEVFDEFQLEQARDTGSEESECKGNPGENERP